MLLGTQALDWDFIFRRGIGTTCRMARLWSIMSSTWARWPSCSQGNLWLGFSLFKLNVSICELDGFSFIKKFWKIGNFEFYVSFCELGWFSFVKKVWKIGNFELYIWVFVNWVGVLLSNCGRIYVIQSSGWCISYVIREFMLWTMHCFVY